MIKCWLICSLALLGSVLAQPQNPPPRSHPGTKELCGEAAYSAEQSGETVTIHASGEHSTGGFSVALEQSADPVFPPEFAMYHWKPQGVATQQISPFKTSATFKSKQQVDNIKVIDAKGAHEVKVKTSKK